MPGLNRPASKRNKPEMAKGGKKKATTKKKSHNPGY